MKGFKVYQVDTTINPVPASGRRDFYTLYLLTGPHQLSCADQAIELAGTRLYFGDPPRVDSSKGGATRQIGYACLFTEEFVQEGGHAGSREPWSVFHDNKTRAFSLRNEQAAYFASLFQKMLVEQQTAYLFKHELLRSYLQLVFHEALRLRGPAPKRFFRYYFQQPGQGGVLGTGRRRRRRLGQHPQMGLRLSLTGFKP